MALADQIASIQEQLEGFDVNDLDFENVGSWPMFVKVVIWILVFALVVGLGYKFVISDLQGKIAKAQAQEEKLKGDFKSKAFKAANLGAYRLQMAEMEESFEALVSQLPSDTEVPGLLEDITNKGATAGLAFKSIDLQAERTHEYYIELPIKIIASGTYHDMGAFVSGVAGLPRIVTLTNFSITPTGRSGDSSALRMTITASTYRYRDTVNLGKKGKRKKKKGKR